MGHLSGPFTNLKSIW